MREYNTYRLTNKSIKGGWQLPIKNIMALHPRTNALKRLCYIPGSGTIWADEYKGDLAPAPEPWFEKGVLRVPKDLEELNKIIKIHPMFGRDFEKYNPQQDAEREYDTFEAKQEVISLIRESEDHRVLAVSMIHFGLHAGKWSAKKARMELITALEKSLHKIKDLFNTKDSDGLYVSAKAFQKGIVTTNPRNTAVVWNIGKGIIIPLTKGKTALYELAAYLKSNDEEAGSVLQEIGLKLEA